jgi:hypothetical protein
MEEFINWLKSIGFEEFPMTYRLKINIKGIYKPTYCFINKDEILNKEIYTKEQVIDYINQTKLRFIKYQMGEYTLTDKELFMLRTFIEALGYENKDNGIWKLHFTYNMPENTYEDSAILDEEDLKSMTLNDAMLRAMDTKRSKETELEFKMKYDMEMPLVKTVDLDDSVKDFVSANKSADCPNCL